MVVMNSIYFKYIKWFMASCLILGAALGQAATTSWRDAGVVKVKFGPSAEAKLLFESMQIKASVGPSKSLKTFRTTDGRLIMQCKREMDRDMYLHSCVASINTNEVSRAETTVYKDRTFWRLNFDNENDAENLFRGLKILEREGRSGFAKTFRTGDGRFELFCTRSKIPFGPKYGCSIAIELK